MKEPIDWEKLRAIHQRVLDEHGGVAAMDFALELVRLYPAMQEQSRELGHLRALKNTRKQAIKWNTVMLAGLMATYWLIDWRVGSIALLVLLFWLWWTRP